MTFTVHLDFESRSRADLPSVGQHRYAIDPSTEILMAAVSANDSDEVYLWINPKYATADLLGDNDEAEALLAKADVIWAHNANFEQAVSWGTHERGAASPFKGPVDITKWRCTAAMARKAGLPYSLEKLAETLGLSAQKDTRGKRLIKLFSEPQKDGEFVKIPDHLEEWYAFCEYCKQDVRAEKGAHKKLKAFELTGSSLETFQFDLRMNQRGVPINLQAARNAQKIIEAVEAKVTAEFQKITGLNPTQREKVRELVGLENMQSETVAAAIQLLEIADTVPTAEAARNYKILQLYQKLSYAAVRKVATMIDAACPDGRVRGSMMYYGASTGRWTSKILQIQNLKKTPSWMRGITEPIYQWINDGADAEALETVYGDPFELISGCIRHFVHLPGEEMLDGDYNAIEGRIGCWIAGQCDILKAWEKGEDLYVRAAAAVSQVSEHSIHALPKHEKADHRAFGKVVELAAQFGLGTDGFMRTCEMWGLECDEKKAKRAVHEYYRPTHQKIVQRWWFLDAEARHAITNPGVQFGPFTCRNIAGIKYLLLKLPSGRSLAYPRPEINTREPTAKEREEMANGKNYPPSRFQEITYWGQLPKSQVWGRVKMHGALFFQNEVQATAADVMAHGSINAEKIGMEPFMLVHDQSLAIRKAGQTPQQYAAAFTDMPAWAKGLPLRFEAATKNFYTK